ncbi:ammonia-forming cytochrome c nitrite reductase [Desulfopila aestuarii]|uniref:nitrite reductase (cytochrome; ammonia-forming) n=1 Tax=Desulfopila aestuarii DSM 18488 TaxID=1121416 RepID=A0A1M7Y717_9BACT|nr:ammonia-forming cytochrome c nitrite reductase [Desulfopila aestuarii]SHO48433.1 respiratory nitrite reductase (cytochrome ammonia-forming) precursor [Desulfopila aestuarii DSM 18488]
MRKTSVLLAGSLVAVGAVLAFSGPGIAEMAKGGVLEKGVEGRSDKWAEKYPNQYNSWKQTSENDSITDMIAKKPQLAILWAGYGFAKDYNAPRGHFYALQSNVNSLRTGAPVGPDTGPMPTACWTCKSPDVPRIMERDGELEYFTGKWAKYGNEIVNSIGCADCHSSQTGELQISRPYLTKGLEAIGVDTKKVDSEDMRTLACAQCHVEYYFKKTEWTDKDGNKKTAGVVTLPWDNGLSAEAMEKYYDDINFSDWTHGISKTPMLKAQHPGYEIYSTGIHAKSGVSCADCHMPSKKEGDETFSDHHIASPLATDDIVCVGCHDQDAEVIKAVVEEKLERKEQLMEIAMDNLAKAHLEAGKAWEVGATEDEMKDILTDIRHAQWKWDYSIASHGSFFHAPEETLRLLAVANETAQQARLKLIPVLAKHGAAGFAAPDFSTKEKAQALAGVNLAKLVAEKEQFKATLAKEWEKQAIEKGVLSPDTRKGMSDNSSYSK